MASSNKDYNVAVCTDAREAIKHGLMLLGSHIKRSPEVLPTIVDGIVADVLAARQRAADLFAAAQDTGNEKLMLVAQRYDEMVINAQVRLLEAGVKAASNEQSAIDRQLQIDAYLKCRMIGPDRAVPTTSTTTSTSEADAAKFAQRAQLLAAAQSTAKDAHFSPKDSP